MPVYSFECTKCENIFEELRRVDERLNAIDCPICRSAAMFILDFSARQGPSYPYMDTNMDNKPVEITSLSQRKKELKKRGLQDCGVQRGGPGRWI